MEIEIIDPYNDTWDDTWKEEFRNEKFRKQVEWELEGMAGADYNVVSPPTSLLQPFLLSRRFPLYSFPSSICPKEKKKEGGGGQANSKEKKKKVAFWGPAPAPISLLELGLLLGNPAKKGKVVVCCPKGYVRRGNVEIVCRRLVGGAAFVEELEDVVGWLVREILGTGDTEKSVEKGEGERDLGGKVGGERESEKRWEAKWNKAEETSDGALF